MVLGISARMPSRAARPYGRVFLEIDEPIARDIRTVAQTRGNAIGPLFAGLRQFANYPLEIPEYPAGVPF